VSGRASLRGSDCGGGGGVCGVGGKWRGGVARAAATAHARTRLYSPGRAAHVTFE